MSCALCQKADSAYDVQLSISSETGAQKNLSDPGISEAYVDALELRLVTRMEELFKAQSKELMEAILSNPGCINPAHDEMVGSVTDPTQVKCVFANSAREETCSTVSDTQEVWQEVREENHTVKEDEPISPKSGMSKLASSMHIPRTSETDQRLTNVMQAGEHSCLQKLTNSSLFRLAVILLIALQSAVLGWESNSRLSLEKERLLGSRSNAELPKYFSSLEYGFVIAFLLEWLIRIVAWRQKFFDHSDVEFFAWNMFDTLLVLGSFLSLFRVRVSWLRSIRLFRVARILRIFRLAKKLRKMSYALIRAIDSMFWLIILLLLMLYIFSLVVMKAAYSYMQDVERAQYQELESGNSDARQDMWIILNRFDSLQSTMLALFASFTNGSEWDDLFKPIMNVSPIYSIIVVFFITLFVFAVMNVVTGVFVEDAMKIAQTDESVAIADSIESEREFELAVERFMFAIDEDKDGLLNCDQLLEALKQQSVKHWLAIRGIDLSVEDAHRIVQIFRERMPGTFDSNVLKDFFQKVQGQARRSDIIIAAYDLRVGQNKLQHTLEAVEKCEQRIVQFESRVLARVYGDEPENSQPLSFHPFVQDIDGWHSM